MLDFIIENIYIFVVAAGLLAQWWKSTQDAKKERENAELDEPEYDYSEEALEEFLEDAERRQSPAEVPPPLPSEHREQERSSPAPVLQRSRRQPVKEATAQAPEIFSEAQDHVEELARQAALAERISGLKEAKQARKAREAPMNMGDAEQKKPKNNVPIGGLRKRLRSRHELRQAIVLKEILAKPVSLR